MDFEHWLRSWLLRHPMKQPPAQSKAYTAEVMSRVKSEAAPATHKAGRYLPLFAWPRLGLALAAACAGIVIAVGFSGYRSNRLASLLIGESRQLAELSGPGADILEPDDVKTVASELEEIDRMMLAENDSNTSNTDDAKWIDDLSRVLNELNEDVSDDDSSSEKDDEQWLDELEMLQQSKDSASS